VKGSTFTANKRRLRLTSKNLESIKKNGSPESDASVDISPVAVAEISELLRELLADVFTLYVKTKNFHWHMSGPHFRDYHLLLDEQASQLFAITDTIAERARKIGGKPLRSIDDIVQCRRLSDNDEESIQPAHMLRELANDSRALTTHLRGIHEVCERHKDVATASLVEIWIDEGERRTWFPSMPMQVLCSRSFPYIAVCGLIVSGVFGGLCHRRGWAHRLKLLERKHRNHPSRCGHGSKRRAAKSNSRWLPFAPAGRVRAG
jgi:starvation-inducible DNA-binding protein